MLRRLKNLASDLMYRYAGKTAQPEARAALQRFRSMPLWMRKHKVALWWLLGEDGTPPWKMAMADAGYSPRRKDNLLCANCMNLYLHIEGWTDPMTGEEVDPTEVADGDFDKLIPHGTWICDQVRGTWEPHEYCKQWSARAPNAVYREYQGR